MSETRKHRTGDEILAILNRHRVLGKDTKWLREYRDKLVAAVNRLWDDKKISIRTVYTAMTGTHYIWVRGRAWPRTGTNGNADS